jgi:radical SAM protein with 4Fe4S-binding SPASM domain
MPRSAIVAVTLKCNAQCVMCDIWKHESTGEMPPEAYLGLPASLREINLTGGEPFLSRDLMAIITTIKEAAPKARLVISSNGLLVERIRRLAPQLVRIGSSVAVRISIDGIGETHDRLRGIPNSYSQALQGLQALKDAGMKDLGIGMTILQANLLEVQQVYELANTLGIEFSVSIVSDSPIFFGDGKSRLRPHNEGQLMEQLGYLVSSEYRRGHPKRWVRAWFEKELMHYVRQGRRSLACTAGRDFFYLDPYGNVYCCHILPFRLGNLQGVTWADLWQSSEAQRARQQTRGCEGCWMVCTARTQMRRNVLRIGPMILNDKIKAHLGTTG